MPSWLGNRLFDMRSSIPTYMHHEPPEELEDQADALYWDFLGRCDRKNLAELEQAEEKLFQDISATEEKALSGVSQIDAYISSLRREKRQPECSLDRKSEIDTRIEDVTQYKPQLLAVLPDEIQSLRKSYETFEKDVFDSVTYHGLIETLYTVRWTICSRHTSPPVNLSLWTEERFIGNLNVGTKWKAGLRAGHRIDVTPDKPDTIRTKRDVKRALIKQSLDDLEPKSVQEEPRKRGRPLGSKNKPKSLTPDHLKQPSIVVNLAGRKSKRRKIKREVRKQISMVLHAHGTSGELKYVRAFLKGKTGADLKSALIHLANKNLMSTDDAVYLYKALTALKTKNDE